MDVQSHQRQQRLTDTRLRASAAVFIVLQLLGAEASAAPAKPASADTVLLELDDGQRATSRALRSQRLSSSDSNRSDPAAALALAEKFVALGRAQHDERYFGYASAALKPWHGDDNAPPPIVALRADIAQHQHRFAEAQSILQTLIERNSADAQVWLMSATLHMSQAQPAAARKACKQLFALRETFAATICLAQAGSINGQLQDSYALVTNLISPLTSEDPDPQYAWALGVAAEMAERHGDSAAAESWLRKALELAPDDLVSRLQLADLLLERKQGSQVIELLASQSPSEPVLLRRALAAQQIGGASAKHALAAWQRAVERSETLGVTLHLRELALGQLDLLRDPQAALQTARRNWEIQREPIDARLLLRAAKAAGDDATQMLVRNWQRDLNYEDKGLM